MTKVCIPIEKDEEVTFQMMAKWWAREVPWGFKEIDEKDLSIKPYKPKL